MTTISDKALLMGWRWKSRFNAPAMHSPPKKMNRTRYMLERFSYIGPVVDCRPRWVRDSCGVRVRTRLLEGDGLQAVHSTIRGPVQPVRLASQRLVARMLTMARGIRNFQLKPMSWS